MRRAVAKFGFLLASSLFMGNTCDGDVLSNPDFELWCGDSLCAWRVDEGSIQRAETWHSEDFGVELVGDRARISQLAAHADCYEFDLLTSVSPNVELVLQIDFLDDGEVEYSQPIATGAWRTHAFKVKPPTWFEKPRISLQKLGMGSVVLGRVRLLSGGECLADALELNSRPNGARCEMPTQCRGGSCFVAPVWPVSHQPSAIVCGGCTMASDCRAGEVCGLASDSIYGPYPACIAIGSTPLGLSCSGNEECSTGVCCAGRCSECCASSPCTADDECIARSFEDIGIPASLDGWLLMPYQCAPGKGRQSPGGWCLRDSDCQSEFCSGAGELRLCSAGNVCLADTDCSFGGCVQYGSLSGKCR